MTLVERDQVMVDHAVLTMCAPPAQKLQDSVRSPGLRRDLNHWERACGICSETLSCFRTWHPELLINQNGLGLTHNRVSDDAHRDQQPISHDHSPTEVKMEVK